MACSTDCTWRKRGSWACASSVVSLMQKNRASRTRPPRPAAATADRCPPWTHGGGGTCASAPGHAPAPNAAQSPRRWWACPNCETRSIAPPQTTRALRPRAPAAKRAAWAGANGQRCETCSGTAVLAPAATRSTSGKRSPARSHPCAWPRRSRVARRTRSGKNHRA